MTQRPVTEEEAHSIVQAFCQVEVTLVPPQDFVKMMKELSECLSGLAALYMDTIVQKLQDIARKFEIGSRLIWIYENYPTTDQTCLQIVDAACNALLFFTYEREGWFCKHYFKAASIPMFEDRFRFPELAQNTLSLISNLAVDLPDFAVTLCSKGLLTRIIQRFAVSMPDKLFHYIKFFSSVVACLPKSANLQSLMKQLCMMVTSKCVESSDLTEEQMEKVMQVVLATLERSESAAAQELFDRPIFRNYLRDCTTSLDEDKYSIAYKILVVYTHNSDCQVVRLLTQYSNELIDPQIMAVQLQRSSSRTRGVIMVTAFNLLVDEELCHKWFEAIQSVSTLRDSLFWAARDLAQSGNPVFYDFTCTYLRQLNKVEFTEFIAAEPFSDITLVAMKHERYSIQLLGLHFGPSEVRVLVNSIIGTQDSSNCVFHEKILQAGEEMPNLNTNRPSYNQRQRFALLN